ncbi:MAG: type II toxin-antitoxin system RelE/ParE family toxin [Luteolibacter sp.]
MRRNGIGQRRFSRTSTDGLGNECRLHDRGPAGFIRGCGILRESRASLGRRFRDEIAGVLNTAASAPLLWRERKAGYRRVNCPVFPYYIAYVIREDFLVVVAVAHGSREPGFWHDRLRY